VAQRSLSSPDNEPESGNVPDAINTTASPDRHGSPKPGSTSRQGLSDFRWI
jgi:hypothetical protein